MASYKLSAALSRYRLVTTDANGLLAYCGAGGVAVGSLQEAAPDNSFPSGSIVEPAEIESGEEALLEAGEALAVNDMFKAGANGVAAKDATKSVDTLGKVLQAATAAGQKVRVVYGK